MNRRQILKRALAGVGCGVVAPVVVKASAPVVAGFDPAWRGATFYEMWIGELDGTVSQVSIPKEKWDQHMEEVRKCLKDWKREP